VSALWGEGRPWWKDGVVYQIYPRSFADASGDGVGDLRGILEHLDHLNDGTTESLGVDAIWLSPIYPSPMRDAGYDISDYCAIAPEFGTMADFDRLLREAHRRGIRVILDLVLNHCSAEHPWFVDARSRRDSPKRDWFLWSDGRPSGRRGPPNDWLAMFGGSAWQWDEGSGQLYMHSFLAEQPDFNWRNPELKRALWDVMRFWLDRGVDGFRLDVVNWFVKDASLRDNPRQWRGLRPYDRQVHLYDRNRPETVELTREIRAVVDAYPDRMTVGEVYVAPPGDPALAAQYYAAGAGLHLAFNFAFLYCAWSAEAFAGAVDRWEALLGPDLWPNYTLSNHDQTRSFTRYATRDPEEGEARARVAAAMLLTLRGTPFLYYGEEIGMSCRRIPRARLRDPIGIRYWPFHPGRDVARTPMQWSAAEGAGFSVAEPWLPVQADRARVNVADQRRNAASLLSWYRRLVHLRRREPALHRGTYLRLAQTTADVFGYLREHDGEQVAVLLNFSRRRRPAAVPDGAWEIVVSTSSRVGTASGGKLDLLGYEVVIAKRIRVP
jgi:alpha-glucosidase